MLDPAHPLAELLARDRRYHFDAYVFVFEALRYAHEKLGLGREQPSIQGPAGGAQDEPGSEQHVTGQELCEAIRQYALQQYGFMAKCVLNHWGVHGTGDFGEIVFNLIDIGQMKKTEHDRREDFHNVFDFDTDLARGFQITLPRGSEGRR
jgi:uncharacterized repeat protein (TIGR04138 family)